MLRLGYKASAEQFGPRELLEFGCLAEEVGFDSVFISDHFQPWRHTGGHAPSALAWLGALGARTSRIVMGTSVLTPTFRYHPSVVAQVFGTLGSLFPGRVILGVGTGEGLNEVPSTGMVWPEMKERFARLRDAIGLIRKLWSEDDLTFTGEYYKTQGATIYDKPGAFLPIYVAGFALVTVLGAGRLVRWLCDRGMNSVKARRMVIFAGLLLGTLALVVTVNVTDLYASVTAMSLGYAFVMAILGPMWSTPADIAGPRGVGFASGFVNFVGNVGGIGSPILMGVVFQHFASFTPAILISAGVTLACGVLFMLLYRVEADKQAVAAFRG